MKLFQQKMEREVLETFKNKKVEVINEYYYWNKGLKACPLAGEYS